VTRPVQRADLPHVVLALRRAGELLGHPCRCRSNCTIGDHEWRSTADMAPGVRAQVADPTAAGGIAASEPHGDSDEPGDDWLLGPGADPTTSAHARYVELLTAARDAAYALDAFVQAHRPDRRVPTLEVTTDSDWCRNHLDTIGVCVARYRGDACRDCYEFKQTYRLDAPASLLQAKHEGKKWTERLVADAVRDARRAARAKRRNKGAA